MSFNNSIIGGAAALIRAAIKSPNFVSGAAGWSINKDGSAEFSDLTLRGTFDGIDYIINASGFFLYSGTPGVGNLVYAVVSPGVTSDPFGNAVSAVLSAGAIVGGAFTQVDQFGNVLLFNPSGALVMVLNPTKQALFFYTPSAGLGNLAGAWSAAAGVDAFGNAYPAGLSVVQGGLILFNQGAAPPAVAGASLFYSSSGGRPRYLAASGADLVLERSAVNMSHISMTTQTLPTAMSGALNYLANEAQVASEYEIEIDGVITAPTGGTGTNPKYNWAVAVDGSSLGGLFSLGAVFITTGNTYTFTLRGRISIQTIGAGGTCSVATDGMFMLQGGAAVGNTQVAWPGGSNSGANAKSFDTTSNHTITIVGAWDATTLTGHKADTYRTRITRRN